MNEERCSIYKVRGARMNIKRKILTRFVKWYIIYIKMFKRGLVKYNISTRKERKNYTCKDCGFLCCWKCHNLDIKKGCRIWGTTGIKACNCEEFPITALHLDKLGLRDKCKYYWNEEDIRLWKV